ncbi:MAG: Radical SAM protein, partial [uncultured bacterium]
MQIKIGWYGKHFGEEPPLVGDKNQGAGGVFFSNCNLRCVFCQNIQISHQGMGKDYSVDELVKIMLDLQNQGAINIDLVTPTIWWKQIKEATEIARAKGLKIPLMWNSNAFEPKQLLRNMNGVVDIYVPDFKYSDDELAFKYSGIKNYSQAAKTAIKEMLWQVGSFKTDKKGVGERGVIVRHMVLPNNIQNSIGVLDALAEIDTNLHISLMRQYFPLNDLTKYPELTREVNDEEWGVIYDYMLN